jgi:16S rRNA processing protein RimM
VTGAVHEVVVGVVGRPWGVKGQFLVDPRGSDPGLLTRGSVLRLRRPGGSISEHEVVGTHFAGGKLVVAIAGCATPEEAAALRGAEVLVPAENFDPSPEGAYYPHELTGLEVTLTDGTVSGASRASWPRPGPDLLVVRDEANGGRERLIPFAEAICRVGPGFGARRRRSPEGLLELD